MSLFSRRSGDPSAPAWCPWFTPRQWAELRAHVERSVPVDFSGTPLRLGDQPTRLVTQIWGATYRLDAVGIVECVRDVPPQEWSAALDAYFARQPWPPRERQELFSGGLARLRPLLRPMVEKADELPSDLEPVDRALGADLAAVLCVQGRFSPYYVWQRELREWDVDPAELWALAMHNLRRETPAVERMHSVDRMKQWYVLQGDSPYLAANLSRIDELVSEPMPHGCWVVAPSRYVLVVSPIKDSHALGEIHVLHDLAEELAGNAAGAELSRQVLWHRDGWLVQVPVRWTGETTMRPGESVPRRIREVVIPPELQVLLDQLRKEYGPGREDPP